MERVNRDDERAKCIKCRETASYASGSDGAEAEVVVPKTRITFCRQCGVFVQVADAAAVEMNGPAEVAGLPPLVAFMFGTFVADLSQRQRDRAAFEMLAKVMAGADDEPEDEAVPS